MSVKPNPIQDSGSSHYVCAECDENLYKFSAVECGTCQRLFHPACLTETHTFRDTQIPITIALMDDLFGKQYSFKCPYCDPSALPLPMQLFVAQQYELFDLIYRFNIVMPNATMKFLLDTTLGKPQVPLGPSLVPSVEDAGVSTNAHTAVGFTSYGNPTKDTWSSPNPQGTVATCKSTVPALWKPAQEVGAQMNSAQLGVKPLTRDPRSGSAYCF